MRADEARRNTPLRSLRASLTACAAAAALAAGCSVGGGDGDERLSRGEFVRQADAVCTEYDRRLNALGEADNLEQLGENADRALPIAAEGVAELRRLEPPEELEPRVEDWLERNDANVEKIEELRDAAREGDERRVQAIAAEAADNEREADRLARRIGLGSCARED